MSAPPRPPLLSCRAPALALLIGALACDPAAGPAPAGARSGGAAAEGAAARAAPGGGPAPAGGPALEAGGLPPVPPPLLPDPATAPADSDAVAPVWLPAPMALAGGAQLIAENGVVEVKGAEPSGDFRVAIGALIGPPVRSPDGSRVALSATVGDGPAGALLLLERGPQGWASRTLIKGLHQVDRLAFDDQAQRLAFAWAGPEGGVAALYVMALPEGAPQRLTNLAPYTPGRPPADFVPLPLGGPPRFDGPLLRWRSDEGEHQVELPQ